MNNNLFKVQQAIAELNQDGTPMVVATLIEAIGSAPQVVGAKIVVTRNGLYAGTIGGGKLEARVISESQNRLNSSSTAQAAYCRWSLQKDVLMSCGGTVGVFFEHYSAPRWKIAIFGAGHVAQALSRQLLMLECQIKCFDSRPEWLARLPEHQNLTAIIEPQLEQAVQKLDPKTFVVSITQGHASDLPVAAEALRRNVFPYVGVLGSVGKSIKIRRDLATLGLDRAQISYLHCPMGLPVGRNVPEEIAVSIAAQLLAQREQHKILPAAKTKRFAVTQNAEFPNHCE
jgi:xanthine dehydrogenase accessory factor